MTCRFHTIGCDNGEDKKSRVIVPVIEGEEQEDSYNGTSSSASENEISRKMYFKLLVLNPIKLNLTFTMLSNEYPYSFRSFVLSSFTIVQWVVESSVISSLYWVTRLPI